MVARLGGRAAFFAAVMALSLVGCGGGGGGSNSDPAEGGNTPTEPVTERGWELVWSDEFEGTALDSSKWNVQLGDGTAEGIPGWGNNELQSYEASNVTVGDGVLTITAKQEAVNNREYTSGRINTLNKLDLQYGRIEASIKVPAGQGLWSAFWMLGSNSPYGTWAAVGEIDIMEVFSRDPAPFTQGTAHYGQQFPLNVFSTQRYDGIDPSDGEFHTYAVEWDEEEIRWFVDGTHFFTLTRATYWNYYLDEATNAHVEGGPSAPFDQPFHLLLNLAVGGNLPGAPVPESFPAVMTVDYVKVYGCNIDFDTGLGCDGFIDLVDTTLELPAPADVYIAQYDLFVDALEPLAFPGVTATVPLDFGVFDNGGALSLSVPDVGNERGSVVDITTSGGGNVSIFSADTSRRDFFGMGSAGDNNVYAGEIQFDLYIFGDETDADSGIQVKMDSGFPDVGFVELAVADLPVDEWTTVTVQISDIVKNPANFGGAPLDLANVLSLVVVEPTGSAHIQLDNIRVLCGHPIDQGCGIAPPASAPPSEAEPLDVFVDALEEGWFLWDCCGGATFAEVADDVEHGQVIEFAFNAGGTVTGLQADASFDVSSLASGTLEFEFREVSPPPEGAQWRLKLESSGAGTAVEVLLTANGNPAPNSEWQTYSYGLSGSLAGLDLTDVKLILIFPDFGNADGAVGRIDNIRFVPAPSVVSEVVLFEEAVSSDWALWDCCGGASFGVVADDEEHGQVVELAFNAGGTVTGFEAVSTVDVSSVAEGGVLQFELKEVSPPPEGSLWRLKLESAGAATAVEVLLTAAGNPAPNSDWQTYEFSLESDLGAVDLSQLKLVMIFPDFGNADGAVVRLDNVRFAPAPPPAIVVYDNAVASDWALWDCCGGASFGEVADDAEHGNVVELAFNAGGTVTGFEAVTSVDATAAAGGTLEFELFEVNPPPEGSLWRLKLEAVGGATPVEVLMTDGGNPAPTNSWQSYSFDLSNELSGINLAELKLVMFFPDFGNADGAVLRIDNVQFVPAP